MDHVNLLSLDENQLHLPVEGAGKLFESAVKVMKKITTPIKVCLYWDRGTPACQSLCKSLVEALPNISSLRYVAVVFVWGWFHVKLYMWAVCFQGQVKHQVFNVIHVSSVASAQGAILYKGARALKRRTKQKTQNIYCTFICANQFSVGHLHRHVKLIMSLPYFVQAHLRDSLWLVQRLWWWKKGKREEGGRVGDVG